SSRLAHARKLLQGRLTRRGITLSAALTAVAITETSATATVSAMLLNSTAEAAMQFASAHATAMTSSISAATLANEVLKSTLGQKAKMVSVIVLAVAAVWSSAGVMSFGAFGSRPIARKADEKRSPDRQPETAAKQPQRVDLYCEPLPDGAIA